MLYRFRDVSSCRHHRKRYGPGILGWLRTHSARTRPRPKATPAVALRPPHSRPDGGAGRLSDTDALAGGYSLATSGGVYCVGTGVTAFRHAGQRFSAPSQVPPDFHVPCVLTRRTREPQSGQCKSFLMAILYSFSTPLTVPRQNQRAIAANSQPAMTSGRLPIATATENSTQASSSEALPGKRQPLTSHPFDISFSSTEHPSFSRTVSRPSQVSGDPTRCVRRQPQPTGYVSAFFPHLRNANSQASRPGGTWFVSVSAESCP